MKFCKSIFLLLFISSLTCAQSSDKPKGKSKAIIGLKGGLNFAKIGGDFQGVRSKVDFHAGLFFMFRKNEKLTLIPEIVFSRQGAQDAYADEIKINCNYLNLPFLFNYSFSEKFFLQAGPQVGFLFSAKKTDGSNASLKSQLHWADVGVGIGVGGNFKRVIISSRYNLGLTNIIRDRFDNYEDVRYPNLVFQLSAGYKLR